MTVSKKLEKQEHSAVKLAVTIGKDDVLSGYDKLVGEYGRTVQIPGFRKGKVPRDILERKFGEAFRTEVLGKLVEEAVASVFEDESLPQAERPLPYSYPRLEGEPPELKLDAPLSFVLSYDVMPQIKVGQYQGLEVEAPVVEIGDEDLDRELEVMRDRNAVVLDRDEGLAAVTGDLLTVNYAELNEAGEVLAGTERQDFAFTLGSGLNLFKFDEEVKGMKKGETRDFEKVYPEDFEDKDLAGKTKKLRVTLTALKEKKLPDLDDDLAQDVDEQYKTLDDLKASIRERLEKDLEKRLRDIKVSKLLEKIMENSPVDLPGSMISLELESRWRNMARQFNTDIEALDRMMANSGGGKARIIEGWRPDVVKALQSRLIVDTLIKELSLEAGEEEFGKELETMAVQSGASIEDIKKYYEADTMKEYLKEDIKERKLFDLLLAENKVIKGKKGKYVDLVSNNG
ncbi:MAG: trigger factor [Treponema sp.]|nr:trigger factor [Treponema sp.]